MNKNVWTLEMQTAVTTNNDMYVKQRKEKTIKVVYAHGSMMFSMGHTCVLGLRNIERIFRLRKVRRDDSTVILKKSMKSILGYLKWENKNVFRARGRWRTDL